MKDDDSQFSFRDLLTTLVPAGVLSWALAMLAADRDWETSQEPMKEHQRGQG